MKAVVFDIDGTLSPEVSWLVLTRELGASPVEHARIYDDYKRGRITYPESQQQLVGLWRATGRANRAEFERIFESRPLDPAAQEVLSRVGAGRMTCIITGSMDLYAQVVARKLGIPHWYANTVLHWNAQGELEGYDYELQQAEKKLAQFKEFCREQGLAPDECVVVGDGENDVELFKRSGRGVLVAADGDASPYREHAWKVVASLGEVDRVLARG